MACPSMALACKETFDAALSNPPQSLKIILHQLHESPSVITYDPKAVTAEVLDEFAQDICCNQNARIEPVRPFLFQRLKKHKRAHIFC